MDSDPGPRTPPAGCGLCPHPISEHVLWEPDEICDGWMHCQVDGCEACWHDWPRDNVPGRRLGTGE